MQPKRPRFNPLILALALAGVLMIWSVLGTSDSSTGGSTMSYSTVVHYFENNQVTAFTLDRNTSIITLTLKEGKQELPETTGATAATQASGGLLSNLFSSSTSSVGATRNDDGTVTVRYKLPYAYVFIENVQQYIDSYDAANPTAPMEYDYTTLKESIPWMEILFYLGMLGCTGFLLFSMMRGGAGGGGIMNVGKAKVKDEHENKKTATFADVAGEDEEKEELKEVVEFLKSPDKFNTLGARIPHGVLLVGPPGTGKTLLARACAGEAGVPFYSISGSDFVEMYVGVGASRVRDLFDKAKKTMPCIIFIDEIDAVGRQRGAGLGGGHDEREQTLNQLLVEMDGFEANDGVIVMAATNRADILDKALLRPGRFDRQVYVGLPDVKGREEILKVHTKNKPLAPDVSLRVIAQRTAGFAGADLENLVNEAALLAARRSRKAITMEDIEEASMKVMAGPEKKSRVVTAEEKKLTAYHEAGHAIVIHALERNGRIQDRNAHGRMFNMSRDHMRNCCIVLFQFKAGGVIALTLQDSIVKAGLYLPVFQKNFIQLVQSILFTFCFHVRNHTFREKNISHGHLCSSPPFLLYRSAAFAPIQKCGCKGSGTLTPIYVASYVPTFWQNLILF